MNTTTKTPSKTEAKRVAIRALLVDAKVGEMTADTLSYRLVNMTPAEMANLFRRVETMRKED